MMKGLWLLRQLLLCFDQVLEIILIFFCYISGDRVVRNRVGNVDMIHGSLRVLNIFLRGEAKVFLKFYVTLSLVRIPIFLVSGAEAGLNTSTVALRVVGGDKKRTQCLGA
jgi:hypothetical protein